MKKESTFYVTRKQAKIDEAVASEMEARGKAARDPVLAASSAKSAARVV